jgi:hypothetical protein
MLTMFACVILVGLLDGPGRREAALVGSPATSRRPGPPHQTRDRPYATVASEPFNSASLVALGAKDEEPDLSPLTLAVVVLSISQHGLGGFCHVHDGAALHCHE